MSIFHLACGKQSTRKKATGTVETVVTSDDEDRATTGVYVDIGAWPVGLYGNL